MLAANHAAYLEYQPLGVVGVIGPWNYPVFTPMGSIAYALAAGNAVVFKPSEYTPAVGAWLAAAWRAAVPDCRRRLPGRHRLRRDRRRAVPRRRRQARLHRLRADRPKVMAACAENLIPVLMELGGKDAMIVDDDADVVAAADAAVWGAMSNAGQTCIGIERVYATSAVYDRFVAEVTEQVRKLRPGSDDEATYGPMTMASQGDIVAPAHRGRRRRRWPRRRRRRRPEPVHERNFLVPTVLLDVPEDSAAVREETFGPTLSITKVRDAEEALERANATVLRPRRLGLLASRRRAGWTWPAGCAAA